MKTEIYNLMAKIIVMPKVDLENEIYMSNADICQNLRMSRVRNRKNRIRPVYFKIKWQSSKFHLSIY